MARAIVAAVAAGSGHDLVAECRHLLDQGREHFTPSVIQSVWDAVLDAEMAPVGGEVALAATPWGEAASLVADASFEGPTLLRAYVRYRAARERVQAGDRAGASVLVQAALEECHRMGAAPLTSAAADLARKARLTVRTTAGPGTSAGESFGLTSREQDVLRLIAMGRSNAQIASDLFISPKTVSVHVSNILTKLDVTSRGEAAAKAHTAGVAI
jgi:DNA-binding CsgD family transcriptional regulator